MSIRILALDTATEACSVALLCDDQVYERYAVTPQAHTEYILPFVDQVLTEAKISLAELDALAVTQGPGSFTGVRIGISVAQGLAYGCNLPVIALSTLNIMAQGVLTATQHPQVAVAIDARMGEIYWGCFRYQSSGHWQLEGEESVLSPQQAKQRLLSLTGEWLMAGTGWQAYPQLAMDVDNVTLTTSSILLPNANDMLPLAVHAWQQGQVQSADTIEPIYLRNQVTWKKLPGRE